SPTFALPWSRRSAKPCAVPACLSTSFWSCNPRGPEFMTPVTREVLASYLDDALSERQTSEVEQQLRQSDTLRQQLRVLTQERDRGEHSVGAIWRRHRLSCPTREQLGSFLLAVLDAETHEYIEFHLKTIGCAFCQANLTDLQD